MSDKWRQPVLRALTAVFALLLLSSSTHAAETREQRFARIDTNGDGVITEDEHDVEEGAVWQRMDANGDENLTIKEYTSWLAGRTPGAPEIALVSVARCFFRTVIASGVPGRKSDASLSQEALRAYDQNIFRWLAGDDGKMTLEESKRVPPPEIIPRVVCR